MSSLRSCLYGFAPFDIGGLFDSSVELFNLPTMIEVIREISVLSKRKITGCNKSAVAVFVDQRTHENKTEASQPDLSHLFIGEFQILDGKRCVLTRIYQSIGFEHGNEVPFFLSNRLEIVETGIP